MTIPARNILITGAGSGLGRGLCISLASVGHRIFATDVNLDQAKQTASIADPTGELCSATQLDVTSPESITSFLADLGESPVDVLINNAGLQYVAPLEEFPVEKWDLLISVMLRGSFLMTQALLPRMRSQGFGRIIHIGSIHSQIGSPFKSAYTAAKHAILGLSKTIALETAGTDITSNTICPSYIRTPLVDSQIAAQAKARGISEDDVVQKVMLEPMPKKCFISVDEIAAAVEYLSSPMARNVTGQVITIDGGWTSQ
jgi:3-hydroxybutyrate dehydrogenase